MGVTGMEECVFCAIIRGAVPASTVYEDEQAIAFMDTQPVNPGHTLVVPRMHASCLADLEPGLGARLFQAGMRMAAAVRRSGVRCEGVNLFVADGAVAGQSVFHVHLHVIPRFSGDGFGLRFSPEYFRRPEREALEQIASSIRTALEG
jgi:histidine triad (HIT) family protein